MAAVAFALVALPLAAVPAGGLAVTGTLSQFAGNGRIDATEGPALSSGLNAPTDLAVDSGGNLYVADTYNHRVEKITPAGQLAYFAGTGVSGTATAGPATSSELHSPGGLAVDSAGNVYIADTGNHRVVKVDGQGQLSFVAGNGTSGAPTAGLATSVMLTSPTGLAFDAADNLYIADNGAKRVLRVASGTQTLSILAGNGGAGTPAGNADAAAVAIGMPADVAVDGSGAVHVSVPAAGIVFKVADGALSVEAGGGTCPGTLGTGPAVGLALCEPTGLSYADGSLYIAAAGNMRLVRLDPGGSLTYEAGDGTDGHSYGSPATARQIGAVTAVTMGSGGVGYLSAALTQSTITRYTLNSGTPPGPPTGISGSPGDRQATVGWTAPLDNGGAPITGYEVRLTPTVQGAGLPVTKTVDGSTLSTTVGSLTNGTTYTVEVAALNAVGIGAYGAGSQNVTPAAVPGLPRNVTLTPSDQALELNFDAPAASGGATIVRYESTWDGGQTFLTVPPLPARFSGLTNGQQYTVRVRAVNAAGNGDWTAGVSATPSMPPSAPTQISAEPGDTEATVHWLAPQNNGGSPVSGYLITLTPAGNGTPVTRSATGAETSTTVTGLQNGTAYTVTVAALNGAGTGPASTDLVTVTPISLAASVTASRLAGQIHVGGPLVTLPLWAMLDKPRTTVAVTLKSLVNGNTVASKVLTRTAAGTEFSGMLLFDDDDVPAWGAAQWELRPGAASNTGTVSAGLRLHSLLGLRAVRSGDRITVSGSARAYHSVLDTYKPWNARPVLVQRWNGQGWTTLQTVTTDSNGNFATMLRIPWKVGIRLETPDTTKIWGATSLAQAP